MQRSSKIQILMLGLALTACRGPQGPAGATGNVGPRGPQGNPGTSISFTEQPATVAECPNGGTDVILTSATAVTATSICNGAMGATGPQGNSGATGSQGPAGTPGTTVTAVQFCTGFTPAYPETFPELGLCISGNLYGVYSANGGFLALLPPGEYSSDGINANCIFTISANCVVSY